MGDDNGLQLSLGLDNSELTQRLQESRGATEETSRAMAASLEQINQKLLAIALTAIRSKTELTELSKAPVDDVAPKVRKVSDEVDGLESRMKTLRSTAQDAGIVFGTLATLTGGLVSNMLEAAGNTAKYEITLKAFTGSAEEGRVKLAEFTEYAKKVPFDLDSVRQAGTLFVQFGMDTEKYLPAAAAMAAAMGKTLPEAAGVLTKVFEGSPRALRQLELQYGITQAKLESYGAAVYTTGAKIGQITTEGIGNQMLFQEAVLKATAPFASALKEREASFQTAAINMKDSLTQLFSSIGTLIAPTAKTIVDGISSVIHWLDSLPDSLKKVAGEGLLLATAVAGIGTGLAALTIGAASTVAAGSRLATTFGLVAVEAKAAAAATRELAAAEAEQAAAAATAGGTAAAGAGMAGAEAGAVGLAAAMGPVGIAIGVATAAYVAGEAALSLYTDSLKQTEAEISSATKELQGMATALHSVEGVATDGKSIWDSTTDSLRQHGVTAAQAAAAQKALEAQTKALREEQIKLREEYSHNKNDDVRQNTIKQMPNSPLVQQWLEEEKAQKSRLDFINKEIADREKGSQVVLSPLVQSAKEQESAMAKVFSNIEKQKSDFDEKVKEGDESTETKTQQSGILHGLLKQYEDAIARFPGVSEKYKTEVEKLQNEIKKIDNEANKEQLSDYEKRLSSQVAGGQMSKTEELSRLKEVQEAWKGHAKEYEALGDKIAKLSKEVADEQIKDQLDVLKATQAANTAAASLVLETAQKKGATDSKLIEDQKILLDYAQKNYEIAQKENALNRDKALAGAQGSDEGQVAKRAQIQKKFDEDQAKAKANYDKAQEKTQDDIAALQARNIQNETKLIEARKSVVEAELGDLEKRLQLNQAVGPQILQHIALLQQENEAIINGQRKAALATQDDPKARAAINADADAKIAASRIKSADDLRAKQDEIARYNEDQIQKDLELSKKANDQKMSDLERLAAAGIDVSQKELAVLREKQQLAVQEIQARADLEKIGKGPIDQARLQKEADLDIKAAVQQIQAEVDKLNTKYKDGTKSLADQLDASKKLHDDINALQKKIKDDEDTSFEGPKSSIPETDSDKLEKLKIQAMRQDPDTQQAIKDSSAQAGMAVQNAKTDAQQKSLQIANVKAKLEADNVPPDQIAKILKNNFGYTDQQSAPDTGYPGQTGTPGATADGTAGAAGGAAAAGGTPSTPSGGAAAPAVAGSSAAKNPAVGGLGLPGSGSAPQGGGVPEGPSLVSIAQNVQTLVGLAQQLAAGSKSSQASSSASTNSAISSQTAGAASAAASGAAAGGTPSGDQLHSEVDMSQMYPQGNIPGLNPA